MTAMNKSKPIHSANPLRWDGFGPRATAIHHMQCHTSKSETQNGGPQLILRGQRTQMNICLNTSVPPLFLERSDASSVQNAG